MSVALDIIGGWRHPRRVMRRLLDAPHREDRSLAFLMAACLLMFVAQWPVLARAAHLNPEVPLDARLGGALMGTLFLAPPVFYAVAGLSAVVIRALGGALGWYEARLALFWALLAATPAVLLQGLVGGFIGPGPALMVTSLLALAGFLTIWFAALREAQADVASVQGAGHAG
ncbi:MAG: YIP1 family protein [Paracoccaceae bacterium]